MKKIREVITMKVDTIKAIKLEKEDVKTLDKAYELIEDIYREIIRNNKTTTKSLNEMKIRIINFEYSALEIYETLILLQSLTENGGNIEIQFEN